MSKKQTQCARVLQLLSSKSEVSAVELSSISLQYAARVCELRKMGVAIANRIEAKGDGTRHGFYRLVRRAAFPEKQSVSETSTRTVPNTSQTGTRVESERNESLFPESYRYPD